MAKPKRIGRAARRAQSRVDAKVARARRRLFELEVGGSPERPIEIESASLVEPRALSRRCPTCLGSVTLQAHEAIAAAGRRLRRAVLDCRQCGASAALYFKLVPSELN